MAYADFLIAPDELARHLHEPTWRIVDCRFDLARPEQGNADYLAGHIPGAVYAHLDRDLAAAVTPESGRHPLPRPDVFAATLGGWGISADSRVVVYDQAGGAIAARLWWMLRWFGHRSVVMLDGGLEAWRRAGLPVDAELPKFAPTIYTGKADMGMIVSTEELQQALQQNETLLIDARDAARFAGLTEPIDAVAGHVPGARSFPFTDSLSADGTWQSHERLEKAWADVLGNDRKRSWITMCGSGVTACHLAISAQLAGFAAPRLYVGSWSEWIRDPQRPVAPDNPAPGRP